MSSSRYTRLMLRLTDQLCRSRFFFNDTAATEIYTLSLHDALPIFDGERRHGPLGPARDGAGEMEIGGCCTPAGQDEGLERDRKSTRLNSSHLGISYAVFCLKKKKYKNYLSDHRKQEHIGLSKEISV